MAITQIDSGGIKNDAVIASKIAEDAVTISDLAASGTPSGTNFLCGNNTWMGVGGDLPVDYNDNIKARWGTGNDLQIFHDASNSVIRNLTGDLYLETSAGSADDIYIKSVDDIWLKPQDGESGIDIHGNGNVKLYYDNSKKFETTADGVQVTGKIFPSSHIDMADDVKLLIGTGDDLQLYHDATNSVIDNNTGNLYINSAGDIYLCPKDSEAGVYVRADGSVEIYHDNVKKFETNSSGVNIVSGNLQVGGTNIINSAGAIYNLESLKLADTKKAIFGSGDDLQIWHDGSHSYISDEGSGQLRIRSDSNIWLEHGTENMIVAKGDNAVELYYDNVKKFETYASGVFVPDSANLAAGAAQDLKIKHDGSNSYIQNDTGNLLIQPKAGYNCLNLITSGSGGHPELYYDNAKKFETLSGGVQAYGNVLVNGGHIYLGDNQKLNVGASDDLQIYHDGSHSYIQNGGTGSLYIRSNNVIAFLDDSGDEMLAKFVDNGRCELYFDNSKKLETTSTGVTISGDFLLDNSTNANRDIFFDESANIMRFKDYVNASFGDGDDLVLWHDGSHSHIKNNTGYLKILADSFAVNNAANNENIISGAANGAVNLYYNDSKKLETTNTGVTVTGGIIAGGLTYPTSDGSNGQALITNGSGTLSFSTISGGGGGGASGTDYNDSVKVRFGNSNDLQLYHDGGNSFVADTGTGSLLIQSDAVNLGSTGGEYYFRGFENGASYIRYDNSTKLETYAGGINVTGYVNLTDSQHLRLGTGNDLELYHDGTNSYVKNNTGVLRIRSADLRLQSETGQEYFYGTSGGGAHLYHANALRLWTTADGVSIDGNFSFGDNEKAYFGTGNDLQIYHDGGNSWVKEVGTGALYIDSYNGAGIFITANNANENMITAYKDGAVNLYYNNSKKFETVAGGVKISGDLEVTGQIDVLDNVQLRMGHSDDLIIYHDGTHSYILDNGTGELRLRGNVIKFNNNGDTETMISATENSEVLLYHNNSQRLGTTSTGLKFRGGSSGFYGVMETNDGNNRGYLHANSSEYVGLLDDQQHWLLNGTKDNASRLYYDNSIKLNTESTGVSISAGHLYLGDSYKAQFGASQDLQIYHNGTNSHIDNNTNSLYIRSNVDNDDGGNIYIEAKSGEHSIECSDDSFVSLYYDGVKKFETTSYGIEAHNEIAMAQVQGANNNHNSPVLFQTSGNRIDGGSGLLYNPAEDALKVNGNNITSQVFRGSGGEARLTCANHSSTNYVKVTNTTDIYGGGTLHGTWNGVGKVLQVLQTTRQDVWSESVGMGSKSGAALSQAITLTSNSNKVLIMVSVTLGASDTINRMALVLEDGSGNELCIHTGGNSGNPNQPVVTTSSHHTTCHNMTHLSFNFLHNPSSSTTYHVKLRHGGSSTKTIYMNRAGCESNNGWRHRGASTIVLQEIAA